MTVGAMIVPLTMKIRLGKIGDCVVSAVESLCLPHNKMIHQGYITQRDLDDYLNSLRLKGDKNNEN